ncbi:MAG: 23S rRNA (guanosine(2251)-2'-O)-methyltransferase RlmB [Pseudomonadota bacterium]
MPRNKSDKPNSRRPGRGKRGTAPGDARRNPYAVPECETLYGLHTVLEALGNPRRKVRRFLASENAAKRFETQIAASGHQPEVVRTSEITRMTGPDAVHQGLLLDASPLPAPELSQLIARPGPIVVLDQITDPHNVGAVLRSCAAFAAAGLVMTARHSPSASSVLAKSASGALEHVPIAKVTNLARAIEELKDSGVHCVGLDSDADDILEHAVSGDGRTALVLGAEGKGLRQKTRETCSVLVRLDMPGAIRSLNVSNAAALALYIATHA